MTGAFTALSRVCFSAFRAVPARATGGDPGRLVGLLGVDRRPRRVSEARLPVALAATVLKLLSAAEFARRRFPDSYRVEFIERG
jgi:hypothetical protein